MTEMKARLVDKDGNPLGTAANPLKISDHSISTATWGSITGTISDQTDLNTSLTAKASSTPAALSILVYDGTPSAGDLTTYDEIYTTPALCFAALPAIINHAVTITMRKADGSAYAASTLQRVVAGGSITIQGEYYYNNTVASAGSGAGKFNVVSAHSGLIQAGDRILLIQYSGTVGTSTPSDAFVDTVASVDGTEITLTTRTSDTFTTSWRYIILRTVTGQIIVDSTDQVTVKGLNVVSSSYFQMRNSNENVLNSMIFEFSGQYGLIIRNCKSRTESNYLGVLSTYASAGGYPVWTNSFTNLDIRNMLIQSSAANGTGFGAIKVEENSKVYLRYSAIKNGGGGTSNGIVASEGAIVNPISVMLDGVSGTYKMAIALSAITGGQIAPSSVTFGSNITTQKSPANWAATTDGSYIS